MPKIAELNIDIKDSFDYEQKANDIFDKFCHTLKDKRGTTRRVDKNEKSYAEHEGISFFWKPESSKKIEEKLNELRSYAIKYFGKEVTIRSSMYII